MRYFGPQFRHDVWMGHDHWPENMHKKRKALFKRLVQFLTVIIAISLTGIAALVWYFFQLPEKNTQALIVAVFTGPALTLLLVALVTSAFLWAFRKVGSPLAALMAAADAVADGDLTVSVPEAGPREFSRLAFSFNRMVRELRRADQQRRNLTADVAHELRTPLHIIQGNLEGILDGIYQPNTEHIQATLDETQLLARLVDDLQTLSLAESGQLSLTKEPVDVSELLTDVVTSFSSRAESMGVILKADTSGPGSTLTILADPSRLDQVLGNLVSNALRHTPPGGTVALTAEERQGGMYIRVTDNGEGIPADDLPYIFDRFWRGDRSRSHMGGENSGLGLAISKQLIQAHGGHIDVESEFGSGTSFIIELPAGADPESINPLK